MNFKDLNKNETAEDGHGEEHGWPTSEGHPEALPARSFCQGVFSSHHSKDKLTHLLSPLPYYRELKMV